jgi:gentisate 1,2-dioxygenase
MDYKISLGSPITEADALAQAAAMGLHAFAFDVLVTEDEALHWHEFNSVTWVIDGIGAAERSDGERVHLTPGVRIDAPAGLLHRTLAGPPVRVVIATDIPYEQWTKPLNKTPADRPEHLAV